MLLIAEDIDGHDNADDHIVNRLDSAVDAGGEVCNDAAYRVEHGALEPGGQVVEVAEYGAYVGQQRGVVLKGAVQESGGARNVRGHGGSNRLNALIKLRNDEVDKTYQHDHQNDLREQNGQYTGKAAAVAMLAFTVEPRAERYENIILQKAHDRGDEVADNKTPDKRTENPDERGNAVTKQRQVVKRHKEQNGGGNDQKGGNAPIQIFFIPSERLSHKQCLR